MQPIYHTLNRLFTDFFSQAQDPTTVHQGLFAFADLGTALLTPALAWQCLQQSDFVNALPAKVSEWLRVLDNLQHSSQQIPPSSAALLTAMHSFWFHAFAWHLPHLHHDVAVALSTCDEAQGFAEPRVLVGLYQQRKGPEGPPDNPATLSITALDSLYARASRCFHAYRMPGPLHLAGCCHGLALALQIPDTQRSAALHPFLVNALKALWNDSEQQRHFVHTLLQAIPMDYAPYLPFRQLYHRFLKGRKALDQMRRTQDRLYHQWQAAQPLKPLIQKALQDVLHQGQVGSVFVFVRHDDHYTPLYLEHSPYAYRQEAKQWCWRSHDNFSQHAPRDQCEKLARQQLQETLTALHQHPSEAHSFHGKALSGAKAVQSRWWSAGESLLIEALHGRMQVNDTEALQPNLDLLWYEDAALRHSFMDACERIACEHRASLQVSADLRACAQQLYEGLSESSATLHSVLSGLSLAQVQQALASLTDRLPFYQCWARRQTGGVPVDGFCQPLMYEQDGDQSVPAVLLWGEVHRAPDVSVGMLPFVSRLHMYEIAPLSDLMRYWASHSLLQWRQDLSRLRVQQQRKDEEYQRIQRAFEKIRKCREQENLAWAELRNQLDPPELLSYGVASNDALQQSYTRLHRPEQITSPEAFLCFLAELSTGKTHGCSTAAEDTLTQLHQRDPHTLVAELFDYWRHLPATAHTLSTAQSLFNYCKIMVYDGSQVETQLPGVLSLAQLAYTFHRMARQINAVGKRQQRSYALPLQLQWQDKQFNAAQLNLRRMLKATQLQIDFMGMPLSAIQDTRQITPCFTLGQEQLAISLMEALYTLYTLHFSPALEALNSPQHLWVKALHCQVKEETACQLRFVLSGRLSETTRHKLSQHSPQSAHDLRKVLYQLRESVGVPAEQPWFFSSEDEPVAGKHQVYFCDAVGQDKHTELVVHLAV